MDKQNLIIFKYKSLYEITKELEQSLNFNIIEANSEKTLNNKLNSIQNYLIITKKKLDNLNNQFNLNHLPIKFSKLIEKINIEFIKIQYNEKSELSIGRYKVDLNSRKLTENGVVLKLTEKEINILIYLFKSNFRL